MNEGNQGSGEATGLPRLRGQPRGCRGKRMHLEGGVRAGAVRVPLELPKDPGGIFGRTRDHRTPQVHGGSWGA